VRIGRHLERKELLVRDAEDRYLASDAPVACPMEQLLGRSFTCRIAIGPQQGCKVFTLQMLPACKNRSMTGSARWLGCHRTLA
jgi:hypothetical protein